MQTENLANNSHRQFYVLLNTNQIKLYTYPDLLKENPLLRKFLNSEWTAYFLDETFYHILNIQSLALKLVKLSYLVGSVRLLPLSHYTFIDHTVKHKKL